ncbi:RNA-binding protein, CCR4-NOT complex subunit Rcd1 [Tilletia horrida]|uniref:RNA-binding protein, CCR4-NOT complex subunit Rcd1 n=1 Tax=Tilletia horrida TaxID=155126 RepID=A0AAN6GPH4_9BASI|nr:RNA-binding protein, CCR4-NOT complex subunit Rcd1 [Tilletia horrida]KAK0550709.1 RNA-binding protein, CCR4-NOT complex subunit Rcd1 [Tilletia horrida]KAK0565966.1 RNA-binding protein, CCR4-NOT complex subunit Rcd1 [Tilletia horrida]
MNVNSFNASLAGLDLGAFASPSASSPLVPSNLGRDGTGAGNGNGAPGSGGGRTPGLGGPSPYAQHYSQYPYQQQQQQQQQLQQPQPQHYASQQHLGGASLQQQQRQQQQQQHLLSLGGGPQSLKNPSLALGPGGIGLQQGHNGSASTTGPSTSGGAPSTSNPNTALSVYHLISQLSQRPDVGAGRGNGAIGRNGTNAINTPASTHASALGSHNLDSNGSIASPATTHATTTNKSSTNTSITAATVTSANNGNGEVNENINPATGLPYGEPGSSPLREHALLELSKKREQYEDLALVLWHSFGVMSTLLQEIIAVYPMLSPPTLTAHASNRVCNALALLQCVASHAETRSLFLQAHIPLFLYPFLNTTSKTRPFEYLRLTSLGVIGALVKQNDNSDVITFLLSTEIIPLCLRIMETGLELSKTVAIFIVQKILLDDMGLSYVCQTYERFYAVGTVLANMVAQIVETQAVRLLKHVVRCYLRLSDNPRAREALRACLPGPLRDATFSHLLKNDHITKRCLATLLLNLSDRVE